MCQGYFICFTGIFIATIQLIRPTDSYLRPRKYEGSPEIQLTPDIEHLIWGSEPRIEDDSCAAEVPRHAESTNLKRSRKYLQNLKNSGPSEEDPANVVATVTAVPYTHPLAGLLVLRRFGEYRVGLEEALNLFLNTGQPLSTRLHYELFIFSTFYPIHKMYRCVPISGADNNRDCQHILVPNEGQGDYAFIMKYVLSPKIAALQTTADEGLQKMLSKNIGTIFLGNNPHVRYVFSVCLSFYNARVGLAYKRDGFD